MTPSKWAHRPGYTKRDRGPKESDILRECLEWLASKHYFFWRSNNVPVFMRKDDGSFRVRALPKYTPRGLPDIMVIHKGKFIAIEVKRPGAALRPEQAVFKDNLVSHGGVYHKVDSVMGLSSIVDFS